MPGLSKADIARLLAHIEPQGVKVTGIKKGVLLRLPDGGSTVVHYSESDHRGPSNLRARLRRAGVTWPSDGQHKQKYKPSRPTIERGDAALSELGWPDYVTTKQLRVTWGETPDQLEKGNGVTAQRYLLHAGYDLIGHSKTARWIRVRDYAPAPLLDPPTPAEEPEALEPPAPVLEPAEPVQDMAIVPAVSVSERGREFLDSVDSRTVDMSRLLHLSMADVLLVLESAGLDTELRVWQK